METIRTFNEKGFLVIKVSNHAGIVRSLYSDLDRQKIHMNINDELFKNEMKIDDFYYFLHHPEFGDKTYVVVENPHQVFRNGQSMIGLLISQNRS